MLGLSTTAYQYRVPSILQKLLPVTLTLTSLLLCENISAAPYPNVPDAKKFRHEDWYQTCMKVKTAKPLPEEAALRKTTHAGCQAAALYDTVNFATGLPDWPRVAACAFAEHDAQVLSLLYEFGDGVKRDPRLALHYACATQTSADDIEQRSSELQDQMLINGEVGEVDICAGNTRQMNTCAYISRRFEEKKINREFARIIHRWPASQQALFDDLLTSLNNYLSALGEENYSGGTGYPAEEAESFGEAKDQFLRDLRGYEGGKLPSPAAVTLTQAQAEMMQVYQKIVSQKDHDNPDYLVNNITSLSSVEAAQIAWASYCQAWVSFAAIRYPSINSSTWLTLLTQQRKDELKFLTP